MDTHEITYEIDWTELKNSGQNYKGFSFVLTYLVSKFK